MRDERFDEQTVVERDADHCANGWRAIEVYLLLRDPTSNWRSTAQPVDRPADRRPTDQWTSRELQHSFVSLMSANGASIELISRLVGHRSTAVTESVYRHDSLGHHGGTEIIGKVFAHKSG